MWKEEENKESGEWKCHGGFSPAVLQHKYQINVDGTVAAYRLPYLLVGDSVVLKQDSIYYEHFYNELQPWKHYIPVKSNLSDLLEKLKWAKDHDEEVRSVSSTPLSRAHCTWLVPKKHLGCSAIHPYLPGGSHLPVEACQYPSG